jgi:hypothetical protein
MSALALMSAETPEAPYQAAKRFGALGLKRGVYSQPASRTDIESLHGMLASSIPGPIASLESAIRVQEASPHSIWSVHSAAGLLGGVAFLPLNALGLYKLIYGKLDRSNPPLDSIAVRMERPVVLYVWAVVARGSGVLGLSEILPQLETQRFGRVDIWADPVSEEGERLAQRFGLTRISHGSQAFYKLDRGGR